MPDTPDAEAYKRKLIERANDYRRTFNSETGRRVLQDLVTSFHFNDPCLNLSSPDPNVAMFRDGGKAVISHILKLSAPNATATQQTEENGTEA